MRSAQAAARSAAPKLVPLTLNGNGSATGVCSTEVCLSWFDWRKKTGDQRTENRLRQAAVGGHRLQAAILSGETMVFLAVASGFWT